MQHDRDLVEALGVGGVDDALDGHVAQVGDLALERIGDGLLAATHDGVGLDAAAAQLGDRVLRRLGLLLARRTDERHQRDVHVTDVVATDFEAVLTDGFEERQDLDVADGATDFGDDDIDIVGRQRPDALLDLVGDVRNDLHRAPEIVASPLGVDHRPVDRTRRRVGRTSEVLVDEPLVVTEVEIGLGTVVGDVDLTVLDRVHRARIDVDVGVELLHRDAKTAAFQESTERRSREALAEGTGYTTSDEDVFCHGSATYRCRPKIARMGRSMRHRSAAAVRNNSAACSRAVTLSGDPDNIRDNSTTRVVPTTMSARTVVERACADLCTATW